MKRSSIATLLLLFAATAAAQQAAFTDVKVRFVKSNEPEVDEKGADLALDHAACRLRVSASDRLLDVSCDVENLRPLASRVAPTWQSAAGRIDPH